jgi:hypothetical protein
MTSPSRRRSFLLAAAAVGALAACSLIVPLDDQQCTVASDCTARGGAFAGATCVNQVCVAAAEASDGGLPPDADVWGCLDQPPEVTNPNARVAITFNVFDALSPITTAGPQGGSDFTVLQIVPVPGISVEGCQALDPSCAKPATGLMVTDDAGQATVTVPQSYDGFFQFLGTGYLPSKLYPGHLLADASTFQPPFALLGIQETSLLALDLKVTMDLDPDGGVGHAFFQAYDCFDRHATGVSFSITADGGPNMVQWYTKDELPSVMETTTDSLGAGGIVNVPVGGLTVTATLPATKRTIGVVNIAISPGAASFAFIRVRSH